MVNQEQEELEREMLRKVVVVPQRRDESETLRLNDYQKYLSSILSTFLRSSRRDEEPLEKRVARLENTIEEMKRREGIPIFKSKAEAVYMRFKDQLEEKHFGKIVAIDLKSEQIVGIGSSIIEAYRNARKKSSKSRFSYRRVGFDFVNKI